MRIFIGFPSRVRLPASLLFMVAIPSWSEFFLGALPRPALRWLESHAEPVGWKNPPPTLPAGFRVAFVKQALWPDHPTLSHESSYRDLILSTQKKTGMMALYSDWHAHAWMVAEDSAPECAVWQQASAGDPDPAKAWRDRREAVGTLSVAHIASVDDVDWGSYHLVISSNISVPSRIVKKHRGTVWSYLIEETGTRSYRQSYQAPLAGYDLFLNGLFRRIRTRPRLRSHVIEMPFNFQRPSSYAPFGGTALRRGILLEKQTATRLAPAQLHSLEPWGPVRTVGGSPQDVIRALMESKYYLQFGGNTIWGNGMIEAAVAGCLAISEPRVMPNNSSLVFPGLNPKTWPEVPLIFDRLEKRPEEFHALQSCQQKMAEWLSYGRPTMDLLSAVHRVRRQRGFPALA